MAKRKRRLPRYIREDPELWEREKRREAGVPSDAIQADLSQQAPNNSYSARLYYRDYEFNCADCGKPQVWTAADQKWWYEVAKGPIYSQAKRCRECRQALAAKHGGMPRISQKDRSTQATDEQLP